MTHFFEDHLVYYHGNKKKYKRALQQLQIALQIDPEDADDKDYENMVKIYLQMIKNTTDSNAICEYYLCIATLYHQNLGNYNKAKKYYMECLKIDAKYKGANYGYSLLLETKGNIEDALKYSKIELEFGDDPNMDHVFLYGYLNHVLGNESEADEAIAKTFQDIETTQEKDLMLQAININNWDAGIQGFLNRIAEYLQNKFK